MRIGKQHIKDFLVAFSFVNLCFVRVWSSVAYLPNYFFQKNLPSWHDLFALLANIICLAILFFFLIQKYRKTHNKKVRLIGKILFLFWLFILLNLIRITYTSIKLEQFISIPKFVLIIFFIITILFVTYLFLFQSERLLKIVFIFLLILSPLFFLNTIRAYFTIRENQTYIATLHNKPFIPSSSFQSSLKKQRVIWLIFDELDYDYLFGDKRPPQIKLDAFEELKKISIFASNAYSPAKETILSIPSYLTGHEISKTKPLNAFQAIITLKDKPEKIIWDNTEPNFFSEISSLGLNTGIIGWHLPYCRLYSSWLEECQLKNSQSRFQSEESSFVRKMMEQIKSLSPIQRAVNIVKDFKSQLKNAQQVLINSKLDFIYIHWPIPHLPGIYNNSKKQFSTFMSRSSLLENQYINNLALTDIVLGDLINNLKVKQLFNESIIIISSDHGFRNKETKDEPNSKRKVPLLIKLKGENAKPFLINHTINTIILHEAIPLLLQGKIQTAEHFDKLVSQFTFPQDLQ